MKYILVSGLVLFFSSTSFAKDYLCSKDPVDGVRYEVPLYLRGNTASYYGHHYRVLETRVERTIGWPDRTFITLEAGLFSMKNCVDQKQKQAWDEYCFAEGRNESLVCR